MIKFDWDPQKELINIEKHGIDFRTALRVFDDPYRRVIEDLKHQEREDRYLCIGKVDVRILTVRFVYRNDIVRIIGAGSWRRGRKLYEEKK